MGHIHALAGWSSSAGHAEKAHVDYQVPFAFTGKLGKVTIALDLPKLMPEDEKKLSDASRAAQDAI